MRLKQYINEIKFNKSEQKVIDHIKKFGYFHCVSGIKYSKSFGVRHSNACIKLRDKGYIKLKSSSIFHDKRISGNESSWEADEKFDELT